MQAAFYEHAWNRNTGGVRAGDKGLRCNGGRAPGAAIAFCPPGSDEEVRRSGAAWG